MSDLARQRIRENIEKHRRGEDARVLDLGNCDMTEVPEEIGECVWVEDLNLSNFEYLEIRTMRLHSLYSISENLRNKVSHLPNSICSLKNLKSLILCGDWQVGDLSIKQHENIISQFINIEWLTMPYSDITNLDFLKNLTRIKYLDLSYSFVHDLKPLTNLKELQYLNVSGTNIQDIGPLSKLINLKELYLGRTKVNNIRPLDKLFLLERLSIGGTQVSDISPLNKITLLKELLLWGTQISTLEPIRPIILGGIPVVFELDLPFDETNTIWVENCPLICPPIEFAMESPQAVRDYFEELGKDGRKLNEVKVIFLDEA